MPSSPEAHMEQFGVMRVPLVEMFPSQPLVQSVALMFVAKQVTEFRLEHPENIFL